MTESLDAPPQGRRTHVRAQTATARREARRPVALGRGHAKLAVIVLAHRGPKQVAVLASMMRHQRVSIYLHVDRRVRLQPFTRALAAAQSGTVVLLPRHASRWGGLEVVDATLDGLARAIQDECDYFILISGQDFPLLSVTELLEFVDAAESDSYVYHWPLPTERWRFGGRDRTDFYTYTVLDRRETCIPRGEDASSFNWRGTVLNDLLRIRTSVKPPRRFPSYAYPVGGWQWWNLSRVAADYVVQFVADHPDYRRYHRYTILPDELFFQSILLGTEFSSRHRIVNDGLRFMLWPEGESHPRALTAIDLPALLESKALFARKVDATADAKLFSSLVARVAP